MNLDDFLDFFNWISRAEGLVSSVLHYDKKRAAAGPPIVGIASELALSATGMSVWTFHIARNQGWTGGDAERLLKRYAIPIRADASPVNTSSSLFHVVRRIGPSTSSSAGE